MTADLARYVLPSRFIERYRPVKSHPHEKRLAGYFFDPNAARFFIRMATVDAVPAEAVWTVIATDAAPIRIVSGGRDQLALGYLICQAPFAVGENLEFPLVRPLTYRTRLRISTLQGLLDDLSQAGSLATGGDIAGFHPASYRPAEGVRPLSQSSKRPLGTRRFFAGPDRLQRHCCFLFIPSPRQQAA